MENISKKEANIIKKKYLKPASMNCD